MENLQVGTRFTQTKEIEMFKFNYVGQEFEITAVENNVLLFSGVTMPNLRAGIDANEFYNYFELLVDEENIEDNYIVLEDYLNSELLEEIERRLNTLDDLDSYSVMHLLETLARREGVDLNKIHTIDNKTVYSLLIEN